MIITGGAVSDDEGVEAVGLGIGSTQGSRATALSTGSVEYAASGTGEPSR